MAYRKSFDLDDDDLDRLEDEYFRKGGDDLDDSYSDREYGIEFDNFDDIEDEDGYSSHSDDDDDLSDHGFSIDDDDEERQYEDERDERFDIDF